jgi:hypothetical protein
MHQKITKRAVDGMSQGSRDLVLWDTEVKGFGVRCRPSGAKYYVLKMRVGGRQRWLTIGLHGSPHTAEMARSEALRLLGLKAGGKDPATERGSPAGRAYNCGIRSPVPERLRLPALQEANCRGISEGGGAIHQSGPWDPTDPRPYTCRRGPSFITATATARTRPTGHLLSSLRC